MENGIFIDGSAVVCHCAIYSKKHTERPVPIAEINFVLAVNFNEIGRREKMQVARRVCRRIGRENGFT